MHNGHPNSHPEIPKPLPWIARYVEAVSRGTGLSYDSIHRPSHPDGSVSPDVEATPSVIITSLSPPLGSRDIILAKAPESDGSGTSSTVNNQSAGGDLEFYRASPHLQVEGNGSGDSSLPSDPEYLGLRMPDFRKRPKLKPKVDVGAWEAPAPRVAADSRNAPADSTSWGGAGLGGAAVQWAPTSGGGKKKRKWSPPISSFPVSRTRLDIRAQGLKWDTTHSTGATTEGFSASVVADRPASTKGQAQGGLAMSLTNSGSSPSQSSFSPRLIGQGGSKHVAPASFAVLPSIPIRSRPPKNLPRQHYSRPSQRHPRSSRQAKPRKALTAKDSVSNFEAEERDRDKESEEQDERGR